MISRVKKILRLPAEARKIALKNRLQNFYGTLRFTYWCPSPRFGYWSYKPDSNYLFGKYPEFSLLRKKWLQGNKVNNAGDLVRFYTLVLNLHQLAKDGVEGDFAELGVYLGNSASILAHFAKHSRKTLFLFDTFEGFDSRDLVGVDSEKSPIFADTSVQKAKELIGHEDVCFYVKGHFPESVSEAIKEKRFAFVHLDCDLYKPMSEALHFFWERLNVGGILVAHDYSSGRWEGVRGAIDEFCKNKNIFVTLLPDKSGSAFIRKS